MAKKMFGRYDLDGSDTVNSWDEVCQMTMNVCYNLKLQITQEEIEHRMEALRGIEDNEKTFDQYWEWFHTTFAAVPRDA